MQAMGAPPLRHTGKCVAMFRGAPPVVLPWDCTTVNRYTAPTKGLDSFGLLNTSMCDSGNAAYHPPYLI